ncbi:MAG: AMP-binding protein [Acidimicrobiia bacterium]|nr:AMP-binding protein [Acidimicrobiia bacterium]
MVEPVHTAQLLRRCAVAFPEREAYVHGEKRSTYAWLDRVADGFAATLIGLGVRPGDVVCLMLPSSIKFAGCYLGALRAGAITSAINGRLGEREQRSILDRTNPAVTVVGDDVCVPDGAPTGAIIPVTGLKDAFGAPPVAETDLPPIAGDDPACIVWTSGTTGEPKGAVYDHDRMRAISANIGQLTEPGDRRLVVLPFPHVGYMTRMWDELANGTTIVIAGEPWSAGETLRLIREERITMGTGVPTQWDLVLAHPDLATTDFSQLRVCGIGGAAIAPDLVRRMRETLGCPVITRYTSTEAGVTTSTLVGDADDVIATTVGRPAPDVELRIVEPTGAGGAAELADGEIGEIVCRSPAMMRGYWHDDATTAATIDADGWLHTGDLGVIDPDGNLKIAGRLKEMYIRGGYNVYPAEVEATLAECPSVAQVAVIGYVDDRLGERGAAVVVAADSAAPPTLRELQDWCRARIADYKAPEQLVLIDALPLNATNKVDKSALAAILGSMSSAESN